MLVSRRWGTGRGSPGTDMSSRGRRDLEIYLSIDEAFPELHPDEDGRQSLVPIYDLAAFDLLDVRLHPDLGAPQEREARLVPRQSADASANSLHRLGANPVFHAKFPDKTDHIVRTDLDDL